MLHISGLFEKYLQKGRVAQNQKKIIAGEIQHILNTTKEFSAFEVKRNSIILQCSPYERQAIFLKKTILLQHLQEHQETLRITELY